MKNVSKENPKGRKRVVLVAGTRPEVIKLAPVFFALKESERLEPVFVSSGQHREMLDQAFSVFGICPDVELGLMTPGQSLPELTARAITRLSAAFTDLQPAAVLLQGDTTTVFAAAVAAFYQRVLIGHVEAGLRTGDLYAPFPEEMNRCLTSPLARWNFCPTELSLANLRRESIKPERCFVTGNTVIDALYYVRDRLRRTNIAAPEVAARLGVTTAFTEHFLARRAARWILVTAHRRESFGVGIERVCAAINKLTAMHDVGVLYPVHLNPQVQEPVRRLLGSNPRVALTLPARYEDFIWLLDRCHFALSDSGGVQEEAPSLGKPVLVLRDTTERPEGVTAGTCRLVGTDPSRILLEASLLLNDGDEYARRSSLQNPYGDGRAAKKIAELLDASV
ncbi:MAG: UDP-N-acetylglucosamine 2-epimerase (non-hydrolyzing) [Verrucomicrobia bacterium]|nr:UDP-N-acetylglucosamine 2-epimerase (non-hydrolyzing) [Verrucomicrobiota bacterium]